MATAAVHLIAEIAPYLFGAFIAILTGLAVWVIELRTRYVKLPKYVLEGKGTYQQTLALIEKRTLAREQLQTQRAHLLNTEQPLSHEDQERLHQLEELLAHLDDTEQELKRLEQSTFEVYQDAERVKRLLGIVGNADLPKGGISQQ
jgi:hypothetical protein